MKDELLLFFDLDPSNIKKAGELSKIQLVRTGRWNHPLYGSFEITKETIGFSDT